MDQGAFQARESTKAKTRQAVNAEDTRAVHLVFVQPLRDGSRRVVRATGKDDPLMEEHEPLTLDVREDLRQGKEPFRCIMNAVEELEEGQSLRLLAIFEPVPLYQVMKQKGFDHRSRRRGDEDWEIFFDPT